MNITNIQTEQWTAWSQSKIKHYLELYEKQIHEQITAYTASAVDTVRRFFYGRCVGSDPCVSCPKFFGDAPVFPVVHVNLWPYAHVIVE